MILINYAEGRRKKYLLTIQDKHWNYYPVVGKLSSGYIGALHFLQNDKTKICYQITKNEIIEYDIDYSLKLLGLLNDPDGIYPQNSKVRILSEKLIVAVIYQIIGEVMRSVKFYMEWKNNKPWVYSIKLEQSPALKKGKSNFLYSNGWTMNGFHLKHFLKINENIHEIPYLKSAYLSAYLIHSWVKYDMFPPKILGFETLSDTMIQYLDVLMRNKEISYDEIKIAHILKKLLK